MHESLPDELESMLRSWMPSVRGIEELHSHYSAAVNRAAGRAGQARATELGDEALAGRLGELASAAGSSRWTCPDITFALYIRLPRGGPADLPVLVEALERVCEEDPRLQLHLGDPDRDWTRHMQQEWVVDAAQRWGQQLSEPLALCGVEADRDVYAAAIEVLAAAWPEQAHAAEVLVRDVLWYRGEGSATMPQMHGAVFMASGRGVARVVEAIVHEVTHLELYARTTFDKLLVNWDQPGKSPLRENPRPLSRVLHAGLVAQRIEYGLGRCLDLLPSDERVKAQERQRKFREHRDDGIRALADGAEWTPLGTEFFAGMQASAELEPARSG